MKERKKVLYISQEINPYLPESPLSIAGRMLPQKAEEQGFEVRTFMPKYGCINERRNQLHEVIRLSGMNVIIDDTDHPLIIKVSTLQPARMQVYFIDNDDYFHFSPEKKLEIETSPEDNDERIMFFARGVIETVRKLRWSPAVIHCLGWVTAIVPLYLKSIYADDPAFAASKIVYALRSENFPGTLNARFQEKLKSDTTDGCGQLPETDVDFLALNKIAIDNSDAVVIADENIDPQLIEYARQSGKPVLDFNPDPEAMAADYTQFYNNLLA